MQRIAREDRIGIDAAKKRVACGVDAGVERVGLAAVFLVDDAQIRVAPGVIHAANGLGREALALRLRERTQLKCFGQHGQRAVTRAVVDDDDLEVRIGQLNHRADGRGNCGFFVVGRHQDADAGSQIRIGLGQRVNQLFLLVAPQRCNRQKIEQEVAAVKQYEVAQDEPGQERDH